MIFHPNARHLSAPGSVGSVDKAVVREPLLVKDGGQIAEFPLCPPHRRFPDRAFLSLAVADDHPPARTRGSCVVGITALTYMTLQETPGSWRAWA